MSNIKNIDKSSTACVLYGVPKVQYSWEECTPFPAALKACLNYMGQEISYTYLMAASGAAFRLLWNTQFWDGGNVDIARLYADPLETFKRSLRAAGRAYRILERQPDMAKEEFVRFIKTEIDQGRPLVALGVIGPPEACIVAGYRENGNVLLGWNFFQDNPEFAKDAIPDESGYFASRSWWENKNTTLVMSLGEEKSQAIGLPEILNNALDVMAGKTGARCAAGQAAYDAWSKAISDDSQFRPGALLPGLFERLMCQMDAMTMIGEGRAHACNFMEMAAMTNPGIRNDCLKSGRLFREQSRLAIQMGQVMGGLQMSEETARRLALPDTRQEIVKLITRAKELDLQSAALLKKVSREM